MGQEDDKADAKARERIRKLGTRLVGLEVIVEDEDWWNEVLDDRMKRALDIC
jgi:hypothetical protein